MNREEKIVEKVGSLAKSYINLLKDVFGVRKQYSGFASFCVEDECGSGNYKVSMKFGDSSSLNFFVSGDDINKGTYDGVTKYDGRIGVFIEDFVKFIVREFGKDVHSACFTVEYGISSSRKELGVSGEFNIVWSLFKPSDFKSYLDELKVNKYHYQHLLGKAGNDTPLSFGEAYYFALKHYNKGGDGFVECTGPKDFEWEEKELGIKHTKKSMLRSFETFKNVCEDRMGW